MLLLTSTSDKLQLITTSTATLDVHASFVDLAAGVVTAGRLNTKITTATTTDVVAAPGASTARNVKTLHISNNHASASNTVTVQHTDGTNVIPIESVTLSAGERLGYIEGVGMRVFDATGREKIPGLGLSVGNANTSDVVANAADTYLTGASLPIAGRLQAGSFFKWRFRATKTAAGIASATFNIRVGTAGTTVDASRCLFTSSAAQTAATDTSMFELDGIFRAVGATAVLSGVIRMDHTAADGAGMGTFRYLTTLSASFDVTPAGTLIGVSCNPGASGVWTFQNVSIEANNLIA
jgi:hypothetical protein